jgi:hypothetical protein
VGVGPPDGRHLPLEEASMSILRARLCARLRAYERLDARLRARLDRRLAAFARLEARLGAGLRVALPLATLIAVAIAESAGRRWA